MQGRSGGGERPHHAKEGRPHSKDEAGKLRSSGSRTIAHRDRGRSHHSFKNHSDFTRGGRRDCRQIPDRKRRGDRRRSSSRERHRRRTSRSRSNDRTRRRDKESHRSRSRSRSHSRSRDTARSLKNRRQSSPSPNGRSRSKPTNIAIGDTDAKQPAIASTFTGTIASAAASKSDRPNSTVTDAPSKKLPDWNTEKPSNLPLVDLLTMPGPRIVTAQMAVQQTMAAMTARAHQLTGVTLPKYYNPASVNPLKYAEQMQKRKLLWQNKEKTQAVAPSTNKWEQTTFSQDQDGRMAAKFKKLMGIKDEQLATANQSGGGSSSNDGSADDHLKKQEELFRTLDQQYEVARISTHTQRGVGLGFSSSAAAAATMASMFGMHHHQQQQQHHVLPK